MGEPKLKRDEPETEPEVPHLAVVPEASNAAGPPRRAPLTAEEHARKLRVLEALLFAASEPLDERMLGGHLDSGDDVAALLADLARSYAGRGINLVRVAGKWQFRTAEDLSYLLEKYAVEERRLSKAALETLSIIAYHQPVTRAEIEEIRGVQCSPGTLDALLETGWIRIRGRRRAPGRPVTYGTSEAFLTHFSLESIKDLPGLAELKGAGLLDSTLPPDFTVPEPTEVAALMPDEDPLGDDAEVEAQLDLLADTEGPDKETQEGDPPVG
jgi:segregation and condensation protein B